MKQIDKTKSVIKKEKQEEEYKQNSIKLDKLNEFISQRVDTLEDVYEKLVEGYHYEQ